MAHRMLPFTSSPSSTQLLNYAQYCVLLKIAVGTHIHVASFLHWTHQISVVMATEGGNFDSHLNQSMVLVHFNSINMAKTYIHYMCALSVYCIRLTPKSNRAHQLYRKLWWSVRASKSIVVRWMLLLCAEKWMRSKCSKFTEFYDIRGNFTLNRGWIDWKLKNIIGNEMLSINMWKVVGKIRGGKKWSNKHNKLVYLQKALYTQQQQQLDNFIIPQYSIHFVADVNVNNFSLSRSIFFSRWLKI